MTVSFLTLALLSATALTVQAASIGVNWPDRPPPLLTVLCGAAFPGPTLADLRPPKIHATVLPDETSRVRFALSKPSPPPPAS